MTSILFPLIAACLTIGAGGSATYTIDAQKDCQNELARCVLEKPTMGQLAMDQRLLECMAKRKGKYEVKK